MCVEKIAYFYPTINGNFTYIYRTVFDDKETAKMNLMFNFGFFKLKLNGNYMMNLVVSEKDNNDKEKELFNRDYGIDLEHTNFAVKDKNYGDANYNLGLNDIPVSKNMTYKGKIILKNSDGEVLDSSSCYFEVKEETGNE